jgi:hypothetical protein
MPILGTYHLPSISATDSVSSGIINIVSWTMNKSEGTCGQQAGKGQFEHGDNCLMMDLAGGVGVRNDECVSGSF